MRPVLVPVLALVLALAGCASSEPAPVPPPIPTTVPASAVPTPSAEPTGPALRVAAIGDSLSRGYNACAAYGDCLAASWITGTDPRVGSIATRLQIATGRIVERTNVARSGVSADDLARQVPLAVAARPDLVTVLIGANDFCRADTASMTPTDVFRQQVDAAITELGTSLPDATLLVASLPDPTALLAAAADDPTSRFLWQHLGGCAVVLGDPRSTDPQVEARRQAVRDRVAEYDAVLQAACATQPTCVWDGGVLAAYRPDPEQLSALDSFHPSIAGLRELAGVEWAVLERSGRLPGVGVSG